MLSDYWDKIWVLRCTLPNRKPPINRVKKKQKPWMNWRLCRKLIFASCFNFFAQVYCICKDLPHAMDLANFFCVGFTNKFWILFAYSSVYITANKENVTVKLLRCTTTSIKTTTTFTLTQYTRNLRMSSGWLTGNDRAVCVSVWCLTSL